MVQNHPFGDGDFFQAAFLVKNVADKNSIRIRKPSIQEMKGRKVSRLRSLLPTQRAIVYTFFHGSVPPTTPYCVANNIIGYSWPSAFKKNILDSSVEPGIFCITYCFVAGSVDRPNWKIRPQGPERLLKLKF